jgi:hypothetical protein
MGRKKGEGAGGAGGGAAPGTGGATREKGLEVEDGADGRAPSVSGREGEKGALVGRCGFVGRKWSGPAIGLGFALSFFFFQIHFKPISNPFKFKSFTCFQIQILTQISPTILKAFHKPFLTTFQTYFKFKPLHKFSQTISQLFFLWTFSQII